MEASVPTENLALSVSPDVQSWVICTSCSTGLPKGVVQNHRNVLHNAIKHTVDLHVSADDCMAVLASGITA
jgi:long-subunit acyl-CoA synthetase (AMP-forming)